MKAQSISMPAGAGQLQEISQKVMKFLKWISVP